MLKMGKSTERSKKMFKRKFLVFEYDYPNSSVCSACKNEHKIKGTSPPCIRTCDYEQCDRPYEAFDSFLVSEKKDGRWVCSCPKGIFRRVNGESICDHVYLVKKNPDKYEVPISVTVNKLKVLKSI